MPLTRRQFLQLTSATTLFGVTRGKAFAQAVSDPGVMWVQLLADGGYDPVLLCDPKKGLRNVLTLDSQIGTAGNIPYCNLNPSVATFFQQNYSRMTVFNGVDTGTNNHEVGVRFSMCGSSNTGYPIFAAQVAAAYGDGKPMPMIDLSGYDETGELLAPTRIDWQNIGVLDQLKQTNVSPYNYVNGNDIPQTTFASTASRAAVIAAHKARLARLASARRLPNDTASIAQLRSARSATETLSTLETVAGSSDESVIQLAFKAYKKNLAVSMNCSMGGFDTHAGGGGDTTHLLRLGELCDRAQYILDQATANAVPTIVVICSDFGRSPNYDGGDGTDHWPNTSIIAVQNDLAKQKNLLPTNLVVGGSTGGAVAQALQSRKVNATSFVPDAAGITMTPGHVYRALRRAAKIDANTLLRRFPLSIVGSDLAIG